MCSGGGQNELHRNKGISLISTIIWIQRPFCLPFAQPRSSFITRWETKDHCKRKLEGSLKLLFFVLFCFSSEISIYWLEDQSRSAETLYTSQGWLLFGFVCLPPFGEQRTAVALPETDVQGKCPHRTGELYGVACRRSQVLVLLFLAYLCVLVYEGLAQYPLCYYFSHVT